MMSEKNGTSVTLNSNNLMFTIKTLTVEGKDLKINTCNNSCSSNNKDTNSSNNNSLEFNKIMVKIEIITKIEWEDIE